MAHIMQLRQRIKTVAMIQKTTHAMRLTSMSTHARLQKKQAHLTHYREELERVIALLKQDVPETHPAAVTRTPKYLTVVVGSQKGLCGAFNTRLFRHFEQEYNPEINGSIITVGKKMTEFLEGGYKLLYTFNNFNATTFFAITNELCEHILGNKRYTDVIVASSHPHSFFIQKAVTTYVHVPQHQQIELDDESGIVGKSGYWYDQQPAEIMAYLEKIALRSTIEELLFNSLIAEQAARFLSMDSSTNNAEKILSAMQRDYNKLRQALITRELMDLTGGLL